MTRELEVPVIPFSVLDLAPINQGSDAAQAFRNSLDLAQHAERWNYKRFWLAEHHNMPGIASAATAVVIGYIAGGTRTIRVGSGGVMLPNHAPLVIAEQFGTLESLYRGRIDLGLGRAVPGAGLRAPIWLLGSSTFSAQLAAILGLPFAFASHFAPSELMRALDVYRTRFQPSEQLRAPYAMVGINVFAADTDAEARRLITSLQQQFVSLRRGTPGPLPPPVDNWDDLWSPLERAGVEQALAYSVVGAPDAVARGLEALMAETGADELMLTAQIYDHTARLRSFEIAAEARQRIAAHQPSPLRSAAAIA